MHACIHIYIHTYMTNIFQPRIIHDFRGKHLNNVQINLFPVSLKFDNFGNSVNMVISTCLINIYLLLSSM